MTKTQKSNYVTIIVIGIWLLVSSIPYYMMLTYAWAASLKFIDPSTRLHMAGRNLSLSELRPGDEIVIRPQQRVPAASGVAVSALPRDVASGTATIDATDIQIMRRVQSP